MRLVFLPSAFPDPGRPSRGIFYKEHAAALATAGQDVVVLYPQMVSPRSAVRSLLRSGTFGWLPPESVGPPKVRTRRSYRVTSGSAEVASESWIRGTYLLFERYCQESGPPDVVYAHSALNAGLAALAIKRRTGVPYVLMEHSSLYARNLATAWQLERSAHAFEGAARLLAVSPELASLLGGLFPATAGRWDTIPNVLHPSFTYRSPRPDLAPSHTFSFVNVGALNENKGHADLIDAFAQVHHVIAGARLIIVGDGPGRRALQSLAARRGIADAICWRGNLSRLQVVDAIAAADALVVASRYETFGLAAAEALAIGRPVVATRSGGAEYVVGPGDGHVVPSRDPDALAQAMMAVAHDYGSYDLRAISQRCLRRFSAAAVIPQVIGHLAAAIQPRDASRGAT